VERPRNAFNRSVLNVRRSPGVVEARPTARRAHWPNKASLEYTSAALLGSLTLSGASPHQCRLFLCVVCTLLLLFRFHV